MINNQTIYSELPNDRESELIEINKKLKRKVG